MCLYKGFQVFIFKEEATIWESINNYLIDEFNALKWECIIYHRK